MLAGQTEVIVCPPVKPINTFIRFPQTEQHSFFLGSLLGVSHLSKVILKISSFPTFPVQSLFTRAPLKEAQATRDALLRAARGRLCRARLTAIAPTSAVQLWITAPAITSATAAARLFLVEPSSLSLHVSRSQPCLTALETELDSEEWLITGYLCSVELGVEVWRTGCPNITYCPCDSSLLFYIWWKVPNYVGEHKYTLRFLINRKMRSMYFLLWDFSCLLALQPSGFPSLHVSPFFPGDLSCYSKGVKGFYLKGLELKTSHTHLARFDVCTLRICGICL